MSTGTIPSRLARTVIPRKTTPSSTAIAVRVWAALRASGGLNAGTPFAIASVPVRATLPAAKARITRRMPIDWTGSGSAGGGVGVAPPATKRASPTPMTASALPTKRYVGTAKMFPDSRRPRRLPRAMSETTVTPTGTWMLEP